MDLGWLRLDLYTYPPGYVGLCRSVFTNALFHHRRTTTTAKEVRLTPLPVETRTLRVTQTVSE